MVVDWVVRRSVKDLGKRKKAILADGFFVGY